jgi:DNA-binding transcriptional MocR family regulator
MQNLEAIYQQSQNDYQQIKNKSLDLDLTRGKPSQEQLTLSNQLDGILNNEYTHNGVDTRNYGHLDGLQDLKNIFAQALKAEAENILIGNNSSLTLMYQTLTFAHFLGMHPTQIPWHQQKQAVKFLCPVPGYDRHFKICEALGIEMIPVTMIESGPDMDQVETLVKNDTSIKGIWNVPRFSNPTGISYSSETIKRMAQLPTLAASDFIVMWDNAYALHTLENNVPDIESISHYANEAQTYNQIFEFVSTSKISHAGSGVAALATGPLSLALFKKHLGVSTIGSDKVNQLRHLKLFNNFDSLLSHMQKHGDIMKPRFDIVIRHLNELANSTPDVSYGTWSTPQGGYFISFETQPHLATKIVSLAKDLGVKLTPAGSTYPYGKDPLDSNIRIAPSYASEQDIEQAMLVFTCCVKVATLAQILKVP